MPRRLAEHQRPIMEGKNVGKVPRTHYKGTFNDGTYSLDSSYDRGEPPEVICGVGQMIKERSGCKHGSWRSVEIHLMPEEAYGMRIMQSLRPKLQPEFGNLRQVSRYICLISLVSEISQLRLLQKMIRYYF